LQLPHCLVTRPAARLPLCLLARRLRLACCGGALIGGRARWHGVGARGLGEVVGGRGAGRMVSLQHALQYLGEILHQVEAVSHLDGTGRALPRAVGVGTAAVAGDDRHAGMVLQPGGEGRRAAVGEEVDRTPPFQVHEDRAVGPPSAQRPIVDAQHARGGTDGERGRLDQAQERVGASRESEIGEEPRPGLAAERAGDNLHEDRQPSAAPGVGRDDRRQRLGEGGPHARRGSTIEAAEVQLHPRREPLPG